jgi:hypothetical protein
MAPYIKVLVIPETLRRLVGRCQALNTFLIIDMEVGSPSKKPTISNRRKLEKVDAISLFRLGLARLEVRV